MRKFDYSIEMKALLGDISECGDLGFVSVNDSVCTVALVDVLGHGAEARQVAVAAELYIKQNCGMELLDLISGLHQHLSGSRGAVVAICRINALTGVMKYTGIGNISVKVLGLNQTRLVFKDGIVGYGSIRPIVQETMLSYNDVLLLHSDGIRDHFDIIECVGILRLDAGTIAKTIMDKYGSKMDDASCIAVKYRK